MKQSFVNINSFTSQKKWKNCYFLFLFYETRENRQRKVFKKSLVICNYASKPQQIIPQIQSQTEQHETKTQTHTRAFFVSVWQLSHGPAFFVGARGRRFVQPAASWHIYLWVFRFRVIGRIRKNTTVSSADWFHFLFEIFRLSHDVYSKKRKKENHKKETELYYSMPLCPL